VLIQIDSHTCGMKFSVIETDDFLEDLYKIPEHGDQVRPIDQPRPKPLCYHAEVDLYNGLVIELAPPSGPGSFGFMPATTRLRP
jgi:hypothetical protein